MMEWHPVFRVGRTRLQVSFTGGHLCGGACTPAYYDTSDPVIQKIIESSAPYRAGRIRRRSIGTMESQSPPPPSQKEVVEYSDIEDLCDYLHKVKGIPLEQLCGEKEACFREANRLGLTLKPITL